MPSFTFSKVMLWAGLELDRDLEYSLDLSVATELTAFSTTI